MCVKRFVAAGVIAQPHSRCEQRDCCALTGERLNSRSLDIEALSTYEAAMVSIESGSAGGQ